MPKRALKWPKYHLNTAAFVTPDLESAWPRVFRSKLKFLRRLLNVNDVRIVGMGTAEMKALLGAVEMVSLGRECREFEDGLDLSFTDKILCGENISMNKIISKIREVDKERLLKRCAKKNLNTAVAKKIVWPSVCGTK